MKGVLYTLEAIIATVAILVGIISIFPIQSQQPTFSDVGYSCLRYMDQSGLLRHYALSGMTAELDSGLRNCLPSVLDFEVKVCPSPDCVDTVPSDRAVYLSGYLIAGENSFDERLINLWVWLK